MRACNTFPGLTLLRCRVIISGRVEPTTGSPVLRSRNRICTSPILGSVMAISSRPSGLMTTEYHSAGILRASYQSLIFVTSFSRTFVFMTLPNCGLNAWCRSRVGYSSQPFTMNPRTTGFATSLNVSATPSLVSTVIGATVENFPVSKIRCRSVWISRLVYEKLGLMNTTDRASCSSSGVSPSKSTDDIRIGRSSSSESPPFASSWLTEDDDDDGGGVSAACCCCCCCCGCASATSAR